MTDYLYWVVDCKTPACESPILLYFLGPHSPSVTHVLQAPDTIEVKCLSCRQTHTYRRDEIHTKIGSLPPAYFVPRFPASFCAALSISDADSAAILGANAANLLGFR